MIRAWTAGIIDGEGCICVRNGKHVLVRVDNTDFRMIKVLHENWGGFIHEVNRPNRPNRKKVWYWCITGWKAIPFLEVIYPYLVCKGEKALGVINLYKSKLSV